MCTREKIITILNKYSLVFHGILSCLICFIIEACARHSIWSAVDFVLDRSWVFLYNSAIIFATFLIVYFFKRRCLTRVLLSGIWLFLGIVNGCLLLKRVTPFGYTDLKMITDLFAMKNNYFTTTEAILVILLVGSFAAFNVWLWKKGPKYQGKMNRLVAGLVLLSSFLWIPVFTDAAVKSNLLSDYFENIAKGYKDYGFVYGFSTSVVDRGMHKPKGYSEEAIDNIEKREEDTWKRLLAAGEVTDSGERPNIILVLLESFIDPAEIKFLECSEDPVPNFHKLEKEYTTGHLEVPVVGAGTANTEFEVLTGMGMRYFGTGEYPYKTALKSYSCESIANNLSKLGYGTGVVHNNGGNFYSRANAFSQMGFDYFISKELMNIKEYTPTGNWPTDDILLGEVEKVMDATEDAPDFVYTITVQGHGSYPEYPVIENPEITVSGAASEEKNYAWEYYINELHEVDKFIGNLIEQLSERDEKTMVIMFGDHLPTMNLKERDMETGSLFKTKYITWNNFGLEKQDIDSTSYQLMADMTNQLGIHEGTMFRYHQSMKDSLFYMADMEMLQYDILYGNRYSYDGQDLYPASELTMGVDEVYLLDVH
ncbi:MAG: LTA synthase family protein, partial [Acetivibrio ethanolgignens]